MVPVKEATEKENPPSPQASHNTLKELISNGSIGKYTENGSVDEEETWFMMEHFSFVYVLSSKIYFCIRHFHIFLRDFIIKPTNLTQFKLE